MQELPNELEVMFIGKREEEIAWVLSKKFSD